MNRRRVILIVAILLIGGGLIAGGMGLFNHKEADESIVTNGTGEIITDDSDDSSTAFNDTTKVDEEPAIIDGEVEKPVTRENEYTKEVFNITLKYCNDYDVDTDRFKLNKALVVQDLMNDYIFINFTVKNKTRWECYDYDSAAFRDESQKTYQKEYDGYIKTKKYDDDDANIYYFLSKSEVATVNDMY